MGARTPGTGRDARRELCLTPGEQSRLLELMQSLLSVDGEEEFRAWTCGPLQDLLPHGMMICGLAEILPQNILIQKVIQHHWPLAYFDALRKPEGGFYSPIMTRWNASHAPQLYEPETDRGIAHKLWLDTFHDFKLCNIAAHGVHDVAGSVTSYFNFSSIPHRLSARTAGLLEILTPHMHLALTRALSEVQPFARTDEAPPISLTERERDVLHWMVEGKTNWEIAQISGRSEHTIKHQVERVLLKLESSNRAQAVAKALGLNLVR